ncbi:MAG TPA: MJ0042-type zinc finger domain-containing protein, partial [Steroidobacteraceae bacterium]
MFTVCPKCALTLVVTAADLRVAQGYVRCGRCLNVFNALARLSEERPAAAPEPPPETTTDAALEPPEAASAAPPPQELTPPEPPAPQQAFAPRPPPPPPEPPTQSSTLDDTGEIEIELDPSIFVTAVRAPIPKETGAEPATQPVAPPPPADLAVILEPEKTEPSPPPEVPEAHETNTVQQLPESAFAVEGLRPRAGVAWKVGAGALAIALALQIVNHYRDALAANPALRGPLSTVYSAVGVKLAPRWNIRAYDVRQL